MGVVSPSHVDFCRFEFYSAIYCNLFVLSFIYLLIVFWGSFTLGRLFYFFLLILGLMELFTFL